MMFQNHRFRKEVRETLARMEQRLQRIEKALIEENAKDAAELNRLRQKLDAAGGDLQAAVDQSKRR